MKPEVQYKTVSLAELGPMLPVGITGPEGAGQEIAVRPWKAKEERILGDLRNKSRGGNVASFVSAVLATMCTRLGPYDFEQMKYKACRLAVSRMDMPDVYYAYVWLRRQAMGNQCDMQLKCPNCMVAFDFYADLDSVQVRVPESPDALTFTHQLLDPFTIRQKNIEQIEFGPAKWSVLETLKGGLNTGKAKIAVIIGSVHRLVGVEHDIVLAEHELDEMSKRDLETITAKLDVNSLGPDMSVEGICEGCGNDYELPIDWGYDAFFGISSRSRR